MTPDSCIFPYAERASLLAQMAENPSATQETWVRSIRQEDPRKGEWIPTSVFLSGESHGQRSLVGYSLWGGKELDTTGRLTHNIALFIVCFPS